MDHVAVDGRLVRKADPRQHHYIAANIRGSQFRGEARCKTCPNFRELSDNKMNSCGTCRVLIGAVDGYAKCDLHPTEIAEAKAREPLTMEIPMVQWF